MNACIKLWAVGQLGSNSYLNRTKYCFPAYWICCLVHSVLKQELLTTVFFIWIITAVILAIAPPVIWNTVVVFTLEFMRSTSLFVCNRKNQSLHHWLPWRHPSWYPYCHAKFRAYSISSDLNLVTNWEASLGKIEVKF